MIVGIDATSKSLSNTKGELMKEIRAIEERFNKVIVDITDYVNFLEDETDELKRLFSMVKERIDEVERDNKALRAYIDIKNGKGI